MKYHRHKQNSSQKKPQHNEKKLQNSFLGKEVVEAYTLSTDARGIGRLEDGSIVFVEDLLPGEKALIKISSQKSSYKRGYIIQREQDSEYRSSPPCPYFANCGGCQLQHILPEKQIDFKIQWLYETLKRIGKWNEEHIKLAQKNFTVIYLKQYYYRRRIRLHFDGKNLGFKERESSKIIPIDYCLITRKEINEKLFFLKERLPTIYKELQKSFLLPQYEFDIELTENDDGKVVLNIINLNFSEKVDFNLIHQIKISINKNLDIQNDQLIHFIHPQIGKFKLKKESFIQPHYDGINSYYTHIYSCIQIFLKLYKSKYDSKNQVKKHETEANLQLDPQKHSQNDKHKINAWDLYAGSGIFSCIPHYCAQDLNLDLHCIAVEGVKESIDSLKLNYKDIPIETFVEDVHDFIEKKFINTIQNGEQESSKANIIILDPPRAGVGIPNMQKIVELCASEACILYLACDPASFARDSNILLEGGFHNKQIFMFDSFGQTSFYELLGFFVKGF